MTRLKMLESQGHLKAKNASAISSMPNSPKGSMTGVNFKPYSKPTSLIHSPKQTSGNQRIRVPSVQIYSNIEEKYIYKEFLQRFKEGKKIL
jgi:hypothetical protein